MGGICTLAFEKQDWDFFSFLACVAVIDMYYCFGYLFCLDFQCSYSSIGQFSWATRTEIGTYLYPYAYQYFCMLYYCLAVCVF
jgi:hypothetical protein